MNFTTKLKYDGAIALITVIIVSAVLLGTGITIVLTSIDLRRASSATLDRSIIDLHKRSCLEESVERLKFDPSFSGNYDFMINGESCNAMVSDGAIPSERQISISVSYRDIIIDSTYLVDISEYPFVVSAEL